VPNEPVSDVSDLGSTNLEAREAQVFPRLTILDDHGRSVVVTVHHARQFTGEMNLFNDREILVSGRTCEDSRVVRVRRADFRRLVSTEADIGEVMMRAFILRRVGFIQHGLGGTALIGHGHAADTLRLQRFMTRNGYPHRLLDVDLVF
jgi:thioredoxin reductase (NADPH)